MKVRVCPKCEKYNLENAFNCVDCGTTLSIKTLLDTETGEMNVKSLAGEKELSDISMDFEEHVLEILNPVKEYGEEVIWGCNLTNKSNTNYGFLILTSVQLICVYFVPIEYSPTTFFETIKWIIQLAVSFTLGTLLSPIMVLYEAIIEIFTSTSVKNRKRKSKFETENLERRVTVRELKDLEVVKPTRRWKGDEQYRSVTLNFYSSDEIELYFLVEQDAYKAIKLLEAYT